MSQEQEPTPGKEGFWDRFGRAGFTVSLLVLTFLVGIFASILEWPPYRWVNNAMLAAQALMQLDGDDAQQSKLAGPTVLAGADVNDGELFLVTGGVDFLPEYSSTGSCLAWIMDRKGAIRHVWEYDTSIWGDLEHVAMAPIDAEVHPVGLHLFKDGSLLVSFHGRNCWPYGIGLARFDADSNLIWKKELFNHHWFTIADDGRIYIGSMKMADSPVRIGDTWSHIVAKDGKVSDDTIMILDADGNLLEEFSVLESLVESGWVGLFHDSTEDSIDALTRDPTHLNDVRVVTAEIAATHELLEVGDMLVSMRNTNAVGIIDGNTKRFKWLSAGTTLRQHSPRFYDGGVLVFDNRGGPAELGGSRLVKIDLDTRLPTTLYPKNTPLESVNPFYSYVAGHIDLFSDSRALITLSDPGVAQEIDLKTGKVLWEYAFVDSQSRKPRAIETIQYVREADFSFNRGSRTSTSADQMADTRSGG